MKTEYHGFPGGESGEEHSTSRSFNVLSPPLTRALNHASGNSNLNLRVNYARERANDSEELQRQIAFMNHPGPSNIRQQYGYDHHNRPPYTDYGLELQSFPNYFSNTPANLHVPQGFESHASFSSGYATGDQNASSSSHQFYGQHRVPQPQPYLGHQQESSANIAQLLPPRRFRDALTSPQQPFHWPTDDSKCSYKLQITDESCYRRKIENPLRKQLSDYPVDPEEQRLIVRRIFDAIKSIEDAEDGEKVKAMFRDQKIPDEVVELASWDIMLRTRDSQECGQLVPDHHRTKYEHWEDFSARMEEIIDILKYSKAVCKQILQPSYIDRVADQPKAEHVRKGCNQKLNQRKATQNKLGKMVMEAGLDSQVKEIANQQKIGCTEGGESFGFAASPEVAVSRKRRISEMDADTTYRQGQPSKSRSRRTSRRLANKPPVDEYENEGSQSGYYTSMQDEAWTRGLSPESEYDGQFQTQTEELQSREMPEGGSTQECMRNYQPGMTFSDKCPLEVDYMVEILKLLGLRVESYIRYNLDDLRFYAHVYNSANQGEKWYHPDLLKGYYGQSVAIYGDLQGLRYTHFTEYIKKVRNIATDRGDIDKDGVYNPDCGNRTFMLGVADNELKKFQQQALGIATNKFGTNLFHQPFNF